MRRLTRRTGLQLMLLSAYRASFAAVGATVGEYITTPEAHGWSSGNTDLQNTAAFQAAIDDASANAWRSSTGRGVVELMPGKIYTVRVNSNGSSSSNPVNALTARSNVEIRTAGKPTRSSGNQAIIQWHSWAGFGTASIRHRNLLWIADVDNFQCGYVQFHGRKNSMDHNAVPDYSAGTNGGLNCISIRFSVSKVVLREVVAQHACTDGLLFTCNDAVDVLVEDCTFTRNRRQGMSVTRCNINGGVSFDQVIFRRCEFSHTGDAPGDIEGLQPGYGVDIEPDQPNRNIYGLTFDDCDFKNNYGSLYINNSQTTSTLFGHGLGFDCRSTVAFLKILNCRGTGNTTRGITFGLRQQPTWNNIYLENNVCSGNGDNDIRIAASGSGTGGRITNMTAINCDVARFFWPSNEFPPPWNTGWSVTIWKGNSNPIVTTNGVQTVTVNNGFPA